MRLNGEASWLIDLLEVLDPTQPYGSISMVSTFRQRRGMIEARCFVPLSCGQRESWRGASMPLLSADPRDLELLRVRDTPRQL